MRTISGRSSVRELLAPLRSRSGATTTISASARERLGQDRETWREVAVVVTQQDAHFDGGRAGLLVPASPPALRRTASRQIRKRADQRSGRGDWI